MIAFIVSALCLAFWPLSLFLANTLPDFLVAFLPGFLITISYFLYTSNNHWSIGHRSLFRNYKLEIGNLFLLPLLLIPFITPKLAPLPFLILLFQKGQTLLKSKKFKKSDFLLLLTALVVFIFFWTPFRQETILHFDYQAQQEVISRSRLYPNIFLARTFHNKARIYLDKGSNRLFALLDPNNYFFSFHPRESPLDNQNLPKFPFISLIFLLVGLYYLRSHPHKSLITIFLSASILNLSLLNIFDRQDFILWPSLALIVVHGIYQFRSHHPRWAHLTLAFFFILTIPQLLRLLIQS